MSKTVLFVLCLMSLMLVSCGMSEQDFEKEYPKALCEKGYECGDVAVVSTCRDDLKDDMEFLMVFCSFDSIQAEKCVNCVDKLTCDEWDAWNAEEEDEDILCTSCDKTCD